jgi:thioredoxin reductase/SAM-dependent methyltransferase
MQDMDETWDCIIVGAGAAGLSAALVLGRARQRTLVVDAGAQSNLPAHGIGGLLGHDGRPPAELYAMGRAELEKYPSVEHRSGTVVAGRREDGGFVLDLADGTSERTATVLLATGMDYRRPDVAGIEALWGRSVFHCPFCHGWEVRDQTLGVLDRGADGLRRALLLREWSDDVTLFTDGPSGLDHTQAHQLHAAGVQVDERPVSALESDGSTLSAVAFANGERRGCEGLLVPITLHQRSALAEQLGAVLAAAGPIAADAIEIDATGHTSVPGLSAAGDASSASPSVANAIAAGSFAASMIVHHKVVERHGLVEPSSGPADTEEFWDAHYDQRDQVWSGDPNAALVREVGDLDAGTALDLGCGEGGDALWLAQRGWQVTAVDVSTVALERGAARAAEVGLDGQIEWQQHDLASSFPTGTYDLVSAQVLHSPVELPRPELLRAAAGAVAPGGTLLIVGHAGHPSWAPARPGFEVHFPTPDEVVADLALDPDDWEDELVAIAPRDVTAPDGSAATLDDAVVRLRRRRAD